MKQEIAELNDRFALIYTGQRRQARNLLRDVVGKYVCNDEVSLKAHDAIQRLAVLMRFELEKGNVDGFAGLLTEHWKESQHIDAGSTNTCIDQIFTVMCIPQISAYHDKRPPAVSMMLLGEEPVTIGILFRKIVGENDSTAGHAENVRWCL